MADACRVCNVHRSAGERIDQTPLMYIVRDVEIVGSHFVFFSLSPGIAGYLAIYILGMYLHAPIHSPFLALPCQRTHRLRAGCSARTSAQVEK